MSEKSMKAIVLSEQGAYPKYVSEFNFPKSQEDEVIVKLTYAALNRRDYWITQGMYPNIQLPVIPGSDGCGYLNDRRVLIYPAEGWGNSRRVQSDEFQPLGMPKNGTLAEYISLHPDYIFDAPEYLTDAEAACVGMAGLTAYRALFSRGELGSGDKVLISGIGGGVALMAFQLAHAAGVDVYVTSGSDDKIEEAKSIGAKNGFNYKNDSWHKEALKQGLMFDVIIDSAGGPGFGQLVKVAAPGGRIVTYGGTRGAMENLNTQIIFWRQLSILGSTMGSPSEFRSLLKFMTKHQIRPIIHKLYHWHNVDEAFQTLAESKQFGKLVFSLQ